MVFTISVSLNEEIMRGDVASLPDRFEFFMLKPPECKLGWFLYFTKIAYFDIPNCFCDIINKAWIWFHESAGLC
jgi:hypothetical protein